MCCPFPRPTTSRRGCSCSSRWLLVCRSFSRGAARSLRLSRRPAAACWSPPDDVDAVAAGLHQLWSDRALSATLADRAFDGVRAHYTIAQSAVRQIEVYESAVRRARRSAVLNVSGVGKQYPTPRGPLTVLSDVSFTLSPGDAAAITGPSGSGKSSLLVHARGAGAAIAGHHHAGRTESVRPRSRGAGRFQKHAASGSSSRITASCLSAACSRTCSSRRWSRRMETMMRRPGRGRASSKWAWARGWTIGQVSCPAERSSGRRSRARSCVSLVSCCATSPPATSIRRQRQRSRRCCWTFTHASATS